MKMKKSFESQKQMFQR